MCAFDQLSPNYRCGISVGRSRHTSAVRFHAASRQGPRTIGGVPMIVRVWRQVRQADAADRVIVATDDERILHAMGEAGGEVMMTSRTIRAAPIESPRSRNESKPISILTSKATSRLSHRLILGAGRADDR